MPSLFIRVVENPTDAEGNPLKDAAGNIIPEQTQLIPDGYPNTAFGRALLRGTIQNAMNILLSWDLEGIRHDAERQQAMEEMMKAMESDAPPAPPAILDPEVLPDFVPTPAGPPAPQEEAKQSDPLSVIVTQESDKPRLNGLTRKPKLTTPRR